jgi:methionyl-tRNA formyltransferase
MRVFFAGTPEIALPSLRAASAHHDVCGVLTSPARGAGRGRRVQEPPVQVEASKLGIPILQPLELRREARQQVAELKPEVLVVFAYGRIFGPMFLSLFPKGGINVHPSLLPRYRGPAPIQAALLDGEERTGVTVQRLVQKMDAGPILSQEPVVVDPDETAAELSQRLAAVGAELLVDVLNRMERGVLAERPQDDGCATYCRLVSKEDGLVDWCKGSRDIYNAWRAFQPWPGIFTTLRDAQLRILRCRPVTGGGRSGSEPGTVLGVDKEAGLLVQTGSGLLGLLVLQPQARKATDHVSFMNGHQGIVGTVLGK